MPKLFPIGWEHGDEYDGEIYLTDESGKRLDDTTSRQLIDQAVRLLNAHHYIVRPETFTPYVTSDMLCVPPVYYDPTKVKKCCVEVLIHERPGSGATSCLTCLQGWIKDGFYWKPTPPPAATPPVGFVLIYDGEWKKDTKPSDIMMAAAKASPQSRFRHILDGSQLKVWREFTPPPAATPPPPTPASPDQAPPPARPAMNTRGPGQWGPSQPEDYQSQPQGE